MTVDNQVQAVILNHVVNIAIIKRFVDFNTIVISDRDFYQILFSAICLTYFSRYPTKTETLSLWYLIEINQFA
jgi:hypothetical protein